MVKDNSISASLLLCNRRNAQNLDLPALLLWVVDISWRGAARFFLRETAFARRRLPTFCLLFVYIDI